MKNLSIRVEKWLDKLDMRWRSVPIRTRQRIAILLCVLYAMLSLFVLAKICFDLGKASSEVPIRHIKNPMIQKIN